MMEDKVKEIDEPNNFQNKCIGSNILSKYYPSCKKEMDNNIVERALGGYEVEGVWVVLQDEASHVVNLSDMAFRICIAQAVCNE